MTHKKHKKHKTNDEDDMVLINLLGTLAPQGNLRLRFPFFRLSLSLSFSFSLLRLFSLPSVFFRNSSSTKPRSKVTSRDAELTYMIMGITGDKKKIIE